MKLLFFIEKQFAVLLMWLLILEGVLAFCLMFIFPPGSIFLVFLGVLTLGVSFIFKMFLSMLIKFLCHILEIEHSESL